MRLFGMYAKIYEKKGVVLLSSCFRLLVILNKVLIEETIGALDIYILICHDDIPQVGTELDILIFSNWPLCCQDD